MWWWAWVMAGLGLLAVEILVPFDFFLFFLGLAAIAVGAATSVGLVDTLWAQSVAFSVLSIGFLVFLRRPLTRRWSSTAGASSGTGEIVGQTVILTEDLDDNGFGKGELRGSTWTVRAAPGAPLARGARCRVDRVEGLLLWVSPEVRPGA